MLLCRVVTHHKKGGMLSTKTDAGEPEMRSNSQAAANVYEHLHTVVCLLRVHCERLQTHTDSCSW